MPTDADRRQPVPTPHRAGGVLRPGGDLRGRVGAPVAARPA